MEEEDIYLVSQTRNGGHWSKLVKSQEMFWFDEKPAREWLAKQPDWFKASNAVFRVAISLDKIERVVHGNQL